MNLETAVLIRIHRRNIVTSLTVRCKRFPSTCCTSRRENHGIGYKKLYRIWQCPQLGLGDMLWYHSSPSKSWPLQRIA